jgi:peptide/nickel transport system ATP-binding protein
MILGLLPPSAGEVLVDGKRLAEMDRRARARLIQPVFQDPFSSLNPRRRVRDIVAMPLVAQGSISRADIARRVEEALARVGLSAEQGTRFPSQLSGGQRQRVAIARALVLRPRIVVCDEPTSALDVSVQAQILNLLAELRRELGLTYLFISHNLAVVEHVASEVAVMYLGRIVEKNESEALFAEPRHPYTRALLASVLTPEPGLGVPDVGLGDTMPDPANIPPGCRFHPRCPLAFERCTVEIPRTTANGRTGLVECHLAEMA